MYVYMNHPLLYIGKCSVFEVFVYNSVFNIVYTTLSLYVSVCV